LTFADNEGELLVAVHRDSGVVARYDLVTDLETPLVNIPLQQAAWNKNDELAFVVNVDEEDREELGEHQLLAIAEVEYCQKERASFEYLARHYTYKLGLGTLRDACLHNAKVSLRCSARDDWLMEVVRGGCGKIRFRGYLADCRCLFQQSRSNSSSCSSSTTV